MTSLYWPADNDPRSLSAAFHRVSLSSFIVEGAVGWFFLRGGMSACLFLGIGLVEGHGPCGDALDQTGDEVGGRRLVLANLYEVPDDITDGFLDTLDLIRRELRDGPRLPLGVAIEAVDRGCEGARTDARTRWIRPQDPTRGSNDRASDFIDDGSGWAGGENHVARLGVNGRSIALGLYEAVDPPGRFTLGRDDGNRAGGIKVPVRDAGATLAANGAGLDQLSERPRGVGGGRRAPRFRKIKARNWLARDESGADQTVISRSSASRSRGLCADPGRDDGVARPHRGVWKGPSVAIGASAALLERAKEVRRELRSFNRHARDIRDDRCTGSSGTPENPDTQALSVGFTPETARKPERCDERAPVVLAAHLKGGLACVVKVAAQAITQRRCRTDHDGDLVCVKVHRDIACDIKCCGVDEPGDRDYLDKRTSVPPELAPVDRVKPECGTVVLNAGRLESVGNPTVTRIQLQFDCHTVRSEERTARLGQLLDESHCFGGQAARALCRPAGV